MSAIDTAAQLTYSLLNIIASATADLQKLQAVKDDRAALEAFYAELKQRGGAINDGLRKRLDDG